MRELLGSGDPTKTPSSEDLATRERNGGNEAMLGMKRHSREYIDECRSKVESGASAYRQLIAAARKLPNDEALSSAIEDLEAAFFNNMLLTLDYFFVHRLAGIEGKDGNPLNEVRILCNSMLLNQNIMATSYPRPHASAPGDKSIKLSPKNQSG